MRRTFLTLFVTALFAVTPQAALANKHFSRGAVKAVKHAPRAVFKVLRKAQHLVVKHI